MSATPFSDLFIVSERSGSFTATEVEAWRLQTCPECGGGQVAVIAYKDGAGQNWVRCVNCGLGMVTNRGVVAPGGRPLSTPLGVAGVELTAWNEVRACLGEGAHTAAVMMCRKLLLHVAVGHGLAPDNGKGRGPGFAEAVQHLEDEGLITKRMRPWVDRIKDVGNEANHEIEPVSEEAALDIAKFTEQLLRLTYEMPALIDGAGAT